jgi:hypothetical protein
MATYDLLPIYKTTYDLLLEIFRFSKSFTREYKYTIGQELKNETIKLILSIYRANSNLEQRCVFLEEARLTLETIRLLLRLTKDLKEISLDPFVSMNEKIESISKQIVSWQASAKTR